MPLSFQLMQGTGERMRLEHFELAVIMEILHVHL